MEYRNETAADNQIIIFPLKHNLLGNKMKVVEMESVLQKDKCCKLPRISSAEPARVLSPTSWSHPTARRGVQSSCPTIRSLHLFRTTWQGDLAG